MARTFNIEGPCRANLHYLLSPMTRMPELAALIRDQRYFILHAPRQVGKTTTMLAFAEQLRREGFVALHTSLLESRGVPEVEQAEPLWLSAIEAAARFQLPDGEQPPPFDSVLQRPAGTRLRDALIAWARSLQKPLVLLLDEADAAQGEAMQSLLAQLRTGFDYRGVGRFPTSVGLIGLRNLRDYIVEVRGRPFSQTSPFNNAISITLPNFSRDEVLALYVQHTEETGQRFSPEAVDAVLYWTDGQPWLVNALARRAVEATRDTVLPQHIEAAKDALILDRVTHLDHLAERLNEPRVARVLLPVLLGEGPVPVRTDDFQYCVDLGLLRPPPQPAVANPLYREVLVRQLSEHFQSGLPDPGRRWLSPDGRLDMPKLVDAFLLFWRENADILRQDDGLYREAVPHLVFMAFLQRVVNGGGRITREYAAGRGRIDLLIEFRGGRHVVELKRARNPTAMAAARRDGAEQLAQYLDATGVPEGWLIIFDLEDRPWDDKLWAEELRLGERTLHLRGA